MIITATATESKSKKQFQRGVRNDVSLQYMEVEQGQDEEGQRWGTESLHWLMAILQSGPTYPWMNIYWPLTQQSGRESLDQCFSGLSRSVCFLPLEVWETKDYYALNNHKYFCIKLLIFIKL